MLKHLSFRVSFYLVFLVLWVAPIFAQGVGTAWVRTYNGPADNSYDAASDIAVDHSGNVYVTGESESTGTSHDYTTIKYLPNGDTAWVRRYNGSANWTDDAYAIAVDASGNVYVTGRSSDSGTAEFYATIKYYPNGDTAWLRKYFGPASGSEAYDIAVDNSGNVYVTGVSWDNGTLEDYATIKYLPNGDTAWVRRYDGPTHYSDIPSAITTDASGNVYVTGKSAQDYATIKYYPDGDTAWVRRYDGPSNSTDEACAIATDSSGNVYVTGSSYYYRTGIDYATIKYLPNGDTAWVRRYNGLGNYYVDDRASAIAVDASGNVYVTGSSDGGSPKYSDYATIKYLPNGDTAWVRRYDGPHGSYVGSGDADFASAIVTDLSGNVYVTGSSYDSVTGPDCATIKYLPNGDTAWVTRYDGPTHGFDGANAIAVDPSGYVYVTGGTSGNLTYPDYLTIKYFQALRGDANGDGKLNVTDVIYLINYLFKGGHTPVPIEAADANCDGKVTVTDVIYLINYLFKGGPSPGC